MGSCFLFGGNMTTLKIQLESSSEPRVFIISVHQSTQNYFMLLSIQILEC